MNAANAVKAHSKLISFPTRVKWTPNLNFPKVSIPPSSAVDQPATVNTTPSSSANAADSVEVFRVTPDRYRRRPIDIFELEYIQNGGPL